jgi:hypothetical protein
MMYRFDLMEVLRHMFGGKRKKKSAFETERDAYDFCRKAYKDTGGVTPELRRAFEFYKAATSDDCAGITHKF